MEQVKDAIVRRKAFEIAKNLDHLDVQLELMQNRFGLPPTMCETHRIVAREGGVYALVKRSAPITIFEDGRGILAGGAPAPSSRNGFKIRPRGKYNDEERLTSINPQGLGLRAQEVVAAALM